MARLMGSVRSSSETDRVGVKHFNHARGVQYWHSTRSGAADREEQGIGVHRHGIAPFKTPRAARRGGGEGGAGAAARPARPPGLRGSRAAVQFYFNDTLLMSLDTACMCVPCRFTQMNECSVQSVVCARLCVVLVGQG